MCVDPAREMQYHWREEPGTETASSSADRAPTSDDANSNNLLDNLDNVLQTLLQQSFLQPREEVTDLAYRACSRLLELRRSLAGELQGPAPLTPSLTAIGQCRQTHWRKLKSSYGNSPSSTRRWPLDNFEEPSNKYKKSSTRQGDSLTRWGRIPTLPTGTKRWRASAMWPMKRMPGTGSGRRRRGLYTHGHHSPAGGSGQNHHIPGPHARGLHQR